MQGGSQARDSRVGAAEYYRRGIASLRLGDGPRAAQYFKQAMQADRLRGNMRPRGRFLSYYGLACAVSGPAKRESIQACELALAWDSFDPRLHLNLARVLLLARRHTRALEVLERGLRLHPGDRLMITLRANVDRRKVPVISSLDRDHAVNRFLGRARYTFRRPESPTWELRRELAQGRGIG
jgi:tetratricopeptide (TPR) repeat protein